MATFETFFALAQEQVKTDGDDNDLLTQYANSAVGIAAGFCRRSLFWAQADLDAARAAFEPGIRAAEADWVTAKTNYPIECHPAEADEDANRINKILLDAAWRKYLAIMNQLTLDMDGIVITDHIVAALLLIVGHLYRNRQEIVAESGAVAIQLPLGAQRILETSMAV